MLKGCICFIMFFLVCICNNTYAQTKAKPLIGAVYRTYKDFLKGNQSLLTYKGETFVPFTYNQTIKIKNKDTAVRIQPGAIFAYYDGKNNYRYFKSTENKLYVGYFKILEVGQMVVYEKLIYYPTTPNSKVKGQKLRAFYSVTINSDIRELNYTNLSNDFKDEPLFLAEITKIQNTCKECLAKKKKGGYQIVKNIEKAAKEHPEQINRKALHL